MRKGQVTPIETRIKLSIANKGNKPSEEQLKKLSESHKGIRLSEETKRKISIANKGKKKSPRSKEHCEKIRINQTGKKQSKETIEKKTRNNRGENHHWWKGGVTAISDAIRTSHKYKLWRQGVFERDNFTCIWCGQQRGNIEADHIIPLCSIIEKLKFEQGIDNLFEKAINYSLFWDINNGRTLCRNCHKKTKTYGNRKKRR